MRLFKVRDNLWINLDQILAITDSEVCLPGNLNFHVDREQHARLLSELTQEGDDVMKSVNEITDWAQKRGGH